MFLVGLRRGNELMCVWGPFPSDSGVIWCMQGCTALRHACGALTVAWELARCFGDAYEGLFWECARCFGDAYAGVFSECARMFGARYAMAPTGTPAASPADGDGAGPAGRDDGDAAGGRRHARAGVH